MYHESGDYYPGVPFVDVLRALYLDGLLLIVNENLTAVIPIQKS